MGKTKGHGGLFFKGRKVLPHFIERRICRKIHTTDKERRNAFELKEIDRFRYRTRYFTDSGIIGSKEFVSGLYTRFKGYFTSRHKKPKAVQGLEGIFSLKRLSENI